MAPRLELESVVVLPELVLVVGETRAKVEMAPVRISAEEWPAYSSKRFPAELAEWQAQIDSENGATPANRAERRAKPARRKPRARAPKSR